MATLLVSQGAGMSKKDSPDWEFTGQSKIPETSRGSRKKRGGRKNRKGSGQSSEERRQRVRPPSNIGDYKILTNKNRRLYYGYKCPHEECEYQTLEIMTKGGALSTLIGHIRRQHKQA